MPKTTHKYSNGEITIVWKPNVCIHSTLCWKGLKDVFNPAKRPWIEAEAATTEKIIEQIKKCPSAALSYFMNNADEPIENLRKEDEITSIEVSKDGPYLIKSSCEITHSNGYKEIKTGTTALCRCGFSSNKPFCDGEHRKRGFTD